jgi:DNA mismatch endonuclease (patch repair protein)
MADTLTKSERSERMSRVRGKNTAPELVVHQMLQQMRYHYSLHRSDLPGNPDIVFTTRKKAIFVHGCFWHRHSARTCRLARLPKSKLDFWLPKLEANRLRDRRKQKALSAAGWKFLIVWECQLGDKERLANKIRRFLRGANARSGTVRRRGRAGDGD